MIWGAALAVVFVAVVGVMVQRDKLPDDAVMRFDDHVVTTRQLEERVQVLRALYGVTPPTKPAARQRFNREAAKSMAVTLVLADEADRREIHVSSKQARGRLAKLIDAQLPGGRASFVDFLASTGISEQDVLREIRAEISATRVMEQVTSKVPTATVGAARSFYTSHEAKMRTPETRRIANIVVAGRTEANAVAARARAGEPFASLAREYSLDSSTRDSGGDLGWLTKDQLEPAFGKVAFGAAAGETFGPVKTRFGWNVGTVTESRAGRKVPFAEAKSTIVHDLTTQAKLAVWRGFLTKLLTEAEITYADKYRPTSPTTAPGDNRSAWPVK